jgi:hypothetical protein
MASTCACFGLSVQVAPLLGHFATPWCNALRNIRDDLEKEQAFRGLLAVVQRAPESAVEAFTAVAGEAQLLSLCRASCQSAQALCG